MKRPILGSVCAMAAGLALLAIPGDAGASSHKEAPFITKNPKVDGTDFYMFNSYESGRTGFVTLIANYQPLQDPIGGPNYYTMDPEALYEIHIDNDGDAKEDLTFQFRFKNTLANGGKGITLPIGKPPQDVGIPLRTAGGVSGDDAATINENETYTVTVVRGDRRSGMAASVTNLAGGSATFKKPLDNIGAKTFGGAYTKYADQYKYGVNIPGCSTPAKLFVGQRAESFAVNLGTIFDLVNAPASLITDPTKRNLLPNPIGGKNITALALEVAADCLRKGSSGRQAVLGGWTTASVRQARVINPHATYTTPAREGGAWAQVSRLGNPLVNEVVIGLADKDGWNASEPKDDGAYVKYVTNPTLPKLLEIIFGAANVPAPTVFPRADLVAAFATGVEGVNANGATAEYLRLNTAIPATTTIAPNTSAPGSYAGHVPGSQNNLGALGCFTGRSATARPTLDTKAANCDPAGYPNGRRPGDDTIDIALRVVEGVLLNASEAPAGGAALHDAVLQDPTQFDTAFPYLKAPLGGT
ncbi:DUF4331 domain-containing protein [Pendulispora albinea]|uniref:DUF4331 domain-containing protein n=1 Tax=Pendulispora albinea TaxID=2741071 RepID=A0ABZ2M4G4_9BACT